MFRRKHGVLTLIYKKFQIVFIWVHQRDIFFILTFRHMVQVIAYDVSGNSASDEILVWKLF